MWFMFPEGTESCSVEQQNFTSEFRDDEGRDWFQAPDHFAPKLLDMNLGFGSLPPGRRPEGCEIDDLLPTFGQASQQIGEQAQTISSLRAELILANESIQRLQSQQRQAESECTILRQANKGLESENATLKARLDEFESEQDTRDALVKAGKK